MSGLRLGPNSRLARACGSLRRSTVAFGLLLTCALACSTTTLVQTSHDAATPAATYASSDCGQCVAQACTNEETACAGDPQCAKYLSCLQGCSLDATGNADPSCEGSCPAPSSVGSLKDDLTRCRSTGPGAACSACGTIVDAGGDASDFLHQSCAPTSAANPCAKCKQEHCCQTVDVCIKDPDCTALTLCMASCNTANCRNDCLSAHPTGAQKYAPNQACFGIQCSGPTACKNAGACLTCVVTQCRTAYANCVGDATCFMLFECFASCNGIVPCANACYAKYPSATSTFDTFVTCQSNLCVNSC